MAGKGSRSRKSYVLEIALTVGLVLLLYLFMTNGGPAWFGQFFAEQLTNGQ